VTNECVTLFVVGKSPRCCNRISGREARFRRIEKRIKTRVYLREGSVLYFGALHWWKRCRTCQTDSMAPYNDGEVNFGPLIDLNSEDLASTEKDATTMEKSPVPVGSSTPHTERHSNAETVDQVLKAITAISIGIERQNSALEDRFSELSKRLDAFETKQSDSCVTLGTSVLDSGLDLFSNHEEVRFSELPAPLSPSPYRQLPQQKEQTRVRPSLYNRHLKIKGREE